MTEVCIFVIFTRKNYPSKNILISLKFYLCRYTDEGASVYVKLIYINIVSKTQK